MSGSDSATTRRSIQPFLVHHWRALLGAGICTIIAAAAELAAPWPLKFILDGLIAGRSGGFELERGDWILLGGICAAVLGLAALGALTNFASELLLKRAGERIVHELRSATYAHLQRLSLAFHNSRRTGDLVTRITGDVNAVGDLFSQSLGALVSAVVLLTGMLVVTMIVDPILAVVTLLVTPLLAVVTVIFQRRVRMVARHQRAKEGEIAAAASETLSAMSVVKAFGTEHHETARIIEMSRDRRDAGMAVSKTESVFSGLVDVLGACATAAVLLIGTVRVAAGALSVGELIVFVTYTGRVYRPLREIARTGTRTQRAMARAERIAEILESDRALSDTGDRIASTRAGSVALERVSFSYDESRPTLKEVTFALRSGERVALVGESGAGKSTIGALIARFYDPDQGRVLIDGHDARSYPIDWLRGQVGFLLQDTLLFSGSVAENIAYGIDAPAAAIAGAAHAAGIDALIASLPDGYDTQLGDRGVGLSGGQRQRIGIARVVLRDPAILVLDEPTTGLDVHSEAYVLDALDVLMAGRTTLMVTHSIPLALTADRVIVIEAGTIVEDGTPQRLLEMGGAFSALAERHDRGQNQRRGSHLSALDGGLA